MSVSNVVDLTGSGARSQSACSSPQSIGSGGVGTSMTVLEETLNICRMTQSMIDITAKQLFGLRRCRTSEDLIQKEICECESKLTRLFSKMLIAKSRVKPEIRHSPQLAAFPNTDQWLQIVGVSSRVAKNLSECLNVSDILELPSRALQQKLIDCGATMDDNHKLTLAISKLQYCTENSSRSSDLELHWSAYKSIALPQSSPKFSHQPRPSTSSLPPVDTTLSPPSPPLDFTDSTPPSPFVAYTSPGETRRRYTPPPTPPLVKLSAKKTFPTTPPPQRRNKLHPEAFQPLTKSKSHESQLSVKVNQDVDLSKHLKKKPGNLVLPAANSDASLPPHKRSIGGSMADDKVSLGTVSGQSSPLLTSPYRKCRSPAELGSERKGGNQLEVPVPSVAMHVIKHKFQNKLVVGACDYCHKSNLYRGKVCKYCKLKFHRDCASKAPPSCGLPEALIDMLMNRSLGPDDTSVHAISSLHGADHIAVGPDSSSATSSCNSSTPSSPAVTGNPYTNALSPSITSNYQRTDLAVCSEAFQFPDTAPSLRIDQLDFSVGSGTESSGISSCQDFVNTNTSNDSDKSDKTLTDTNSSVERSVLDRLDSQDSTDDLQGQPWHRNNSISVTLKEWDIPYSELEVGERIGVGRFGTVYKGKWHGDVAIKQLNLHSDSDCNAQLQAFKLEVATLRKTRHENLVLFMGACMTPPKLAIVTSLCKGQTLFTLLHKRKEKFALTRIINIGTQIVQGVGYLNARGIIHKDLKSKNVFLEDGLQQTFKVVISDFGLFSVTKLCQGSRKGRWLSIPPGWLCYLPPEVMQRLRAGNQMEMDLPFSSASDVYAFGTIWYELLCGEWPFKKQPPESIIWQVGKGMKQSLTHVQASREVKDVLMQCWAYNRNDRPEFKDLLDTFSHLPKKRLARSPSHPVQLSRSAESVF